MRINIIICFLRGLWESLIHQAYISGHEYIEQNDPNIPKNISILKCEMCNHYSFGWHR